MKLKINVTQEHITNGVKGEGDSCAIARAVREIWTKADVSCSTIQCGSDEKLHMVLPEEARIFIEDFDNGRGVDPFEFEVDVPEEVIGIMGNMDEVRELIAKAPSLELIED